MLELYRACPRCGVPAKLGLVRCEACGTVLDKKAVSKLRRWLDAIVGAVVLALAVGMLLHGDWLANLSGAKSSQKAEQKAGRRPWAYGGTEPAARAWASRLENSLEDVCAQTYRRFSDQKFLEPTLNFQLLGGNLVAAREMYRLAKRTKTTVPRLLPEEVADGRAAIGEREPFMKACLTQAYERIEPCAKYKDKLTSADASACMVPPVQQMLGALAYRVCAQHAQLQRVKDLCVLSASRADDQPLPKAAAGM